jgi:hypothetical protein
MPEKKNALQTAILSLEHENTIIHINNNMESNSHTKEAEIELKPCPFCGAKPAVNPKPIGDGTHERTPMQINNENLKQGSRVAVIGTISHINSDGTAFISFEGNRTPAIYMDINDANLTSLPPSPEPRCEHLNPLTGEDNEGIVRPSGVCKTCESLAVFAKSMEPSREGKSFVELFGENGEGWTVMPGRKWRVSMDSPEYYLSAGIYEESEKTTFRKCGQDNALSGLDLMTDGKSENGALSWYAPLALLTLVSEPHPSEPTPEAEESGEGTMNPWLIVQKLDGVNYKEVRRFKGDRAQFGVGRNFTGLAMHHPELFRGVNVNGIRVTLDGIVISVADPKDQSFEPTPEAIDDDEPEIISDREWHETRPTPEVAPVTEVPLTVREEFFKQLDITAAGKTDSFDSFTKCVGMFDALLRDKAELEKRLSVAQSTDERFHKLEEANAKIEAETDYRYLTRCGWREEDGFFEHKNAEITTPDHAVRIQYEWVIESQSAEIARLTAHRAFPFASQRDRAECRQKNKLK